MKIQDNQLTSTKNEVQDEPWNRAFSFVATGSRDTLIEITTKEHVLKALELLQDEVMVDILDVRNFIHEIN